jgi:hypothetical protein
MNLIPLYNILDKEFSAKLWPVTDIFKRITSNFLPAMIVINLDSPCSDYQVAVVEKVEYRFPAVSVLTRSVC